MPIRRKSLLPAIAFAVFSVTLIAFGGHLLLREAAFRRRAVRLSGRIVAAVAHPGDQTVYCPRVSFTRPDGTRATEDGRSCDSDPSWHRTQLVRLLWDPKPPHVLELPDFDHAWLVDAFVLGLGILFALAAVATALL